MKSTTASLGFLPRPANEDARLESLFSYRILDTEPERDFDELTALASELLGKKISLVTIVAQDEQWFKSKVGLPVDRTSRQFSFCDHAMRQPGEIFEIEDSRSDARFSSNPFVVGAPHVIHYAGMPLVNDEGFGLGSFCVIDEKPGKLTDQEASILRTLGRQVMMQLELRRKVHQLEEEQTALSSINTELERFADVAAHDLRSPLRAIGSFAGLLQRRLDDRLVPEEVEMFSHLRLGASRLNTMVEGILAVAKAGQQDFSANERIDLSQLVGEVADLVDPEQAHVITFEGSPKRISASPTALRQVLLNLVSNAVKYCRKPSACIVVQADQTDDGLRIAVCDDGPGIAPEDCERIFKAFETGADTPQVPSTGLGLAIVRRVLARLGATISLESTLGEGSRFTFLLPES